MMASAPCRLTDDDAPVTHPPMISPRVADHLLFAFVVLGIAASSRACIAAETAALGRDHRHHAHRPAHHRPAGAVRRHAVRVAPPPPPASTVPSTPTPPPPRTPLVGRSPGLPLPRFASLRADAVNMRAGPGEQYPILWVFKRQGMPIEIEREYDVWRLVAAPDGTRGWVHQATLIGARTFFVPAGSPALTLRARPDDTAGPRAILKPEVIGRFTACNAGSPWCRVTVHGIDGFLQRSAIWGLLPDEVIGATS